ncbi:MAG TPA: hypothetical protein VE221_03440 [Sphingomicrobium sp.]|nr:hypothetical protein [Sphingomicrobium sp.]
MLETDDDDGAGGGDFGIDLIGELNYQPRIAAGGRQRRLTLDRIVFAARRDRRTGQDQHGRKP